MIKYHCDFCGKETKSINQNKEWLKSTGVKEVCDSCLETLNDVNDLANAQFTKAKNKSIKDWIIKNRHQ